MFLARHLGASQFLDPDGWPGLKYAVRSVLRGAVRDRVIATGLRADRAGCDVVTVQRALGHAKATTTLNTYAHLWPTAEDRTLAAAAGLMAGTSATLADYSRSKPY